MKSNSAGRKRNIDNKKVLENYIQPKVEHIIEKIGLEYNLSKKESLNLYYLYYKEFVLKSLTVGNFKYLRILGMGHISISIKKLNNFKKSKYNTEEYVETIERLLKNAERPYGRVVVNSGRDKDVSL